MLHLRPFRRGDAKTIITWMPDEEGFYRWTAGIMGEFPLTEDRFLDAVAGRDANDHYFPFTAFDENGPVGFFQLRIVGDRSEIARFGFVIVDPSIRGKGYGKQMLRLGQIFAFEVYGAEKASLGVFDNNPGAYHCYKSVGFVENGEVEDYPIRGQIWRCIEMDMERS